MCSWNCVHWRAEDLGGRLADGRHAAHGALGPTLRGQLARGGGHEACGPEDEHREHEQQVDGASNRLHEEPRQQPAGHRPERCATGHEGEQALGLTRVEERVGERPALHRRDDGKAVHPDIEGARKNRRGKPPQQPPEGEHIRREEQQRPDHHRLLAKPGGQFRVDRHEHRQRDRHGDVHVDQPVRVKTAQKQTAADGFREEERGHDQQRVAENQQQRPDLAGPDVDKMAKRIPHRAGRSRAVRAAIISLVVA